MQPVVSSVVKFISGRGVGRAAGRYMDNFFSSTPTFKQYQGY